MRKLLLIIVMLVSGLSPWGVSYAESVGTGFSYQGHLSDGDVSANGLHDFVFRIYDAPTGGSQRGMPITLNDIDVVEGRFSVKLDYGSATFWGEALWLEIDVRPGDGSGGYTTLSPRQELTAAPYALTLRPSAEVIGTSVNGAVLSIKNKSTAGTSIGLRAESDSTSGGVSALYGRITSTAAGGFSAGVRGVNEGVGGNGIGVYGSQNGSGWGVYGTTPNGTGVRGYASGTSGLNYGIYGGTNSSGGYAGYFNGRCYFTGNVGIGTTNPTKKLHVKGGDIFADDGDLIAGNGGSLVVSGGGMVNVMNIMGNSVIRLDPGLRRITTPVLEITGGGDLAEPFDIVGCEVVKPGMVVSIDVDHPGQLCIAEKAYDRTVVGCVSGANGINPGLIMQQEGTAASGSLPVALSGRVYCWADASDGSIQPGDLLTTSDTPGHAMKVVDYTRAQGAILGKAMTSLEEGRGLILVLVTLQ